MMSTHSDRAYGRLGRGPGRLVLRILVLALPLLLAVGSVTASDVLNITCTSGSDTIILDLDDSEVRGCGAPIGYTGIEQLNLDGGGGSDTLNVEGTAGDDLLTYVPSGPAAGSFQLAGLSTDFRFTGISGTFLVEWNGGFDTVVVEGNASHNALDASCSGATTSVAVDAFKAIEFLTDQITSLGIKAAAATIRYSSISAPASRSRPEASPLTGKAMAPPATPWYSQGAHSPP